MHQEEIGAKGHLWSILFFPCLPAACHQAPASNKRGGKGGKQDLPASLVEWHISSRQLLAQLTGTVKQEVVPKVAGVNTHFSVRQVAGINVLLLLRGKLVGILHA